MSEPVAAIVPIKSAWWSKISWAQMIGLAASLLAIWNIDVPPEVQRSLESAIVAVTTLVTIVLKIYFTTTVTPQAVSNATVVQPHETVAAVAGTGAPNAVVSLKV